MVYGFFSFVLSLTSTVCELFFTKEVPCFTLQDIFISGEVLVLAFLSDLSNLWLHIFCSRYGFFSFVKKVSLSSGRKVSLSRFPSESFFKRWPQSFLKQVSLRKFL